MSAPPRLPPELQAVPTRPLEVSRSVPTRYTRTSSSPRDLRMQMVRPRTNCQEGNER